MSCPCKEDFPVQSFSGTYPMSLTSLSQPTVRSGKEDGDPFLFRTKISALVFSTSPILTPASRSGKRKLLRKSASCHYTIQQYLSAINTLFLTKLFHLLPQTGEISVYTLLSYQLIALRCFSIFYTIQRYLLSPSPIGSFQPKAGYSSLTCSAFWHNGMRALSGEKID